MFVRSIFSLTAKPSLGFMSNDAVKQVAQGGFLKNLLGATKIRRHP